MGGGTETPSFGEPSFDPGTPSSVEPSFDPGDTSIPPIDSTPIRVRVGVRVRVSLVGT